MVIKKCNICDRRFKKTEHFKRHERSHTKEKPYECNVCHKRFSRSDVLSRHAKGHNGPAAHSTTKALNQQPPASSAQDFHYQPSNIPDNGQQFFPNVDAGVYSNSIQTQAVGPRDIPITAAAGLPSSLDFLADVSSHHARTEPEANSMLVVDQQTYFEEPTVYQPSYRGPVFDPMPNESLQLWLNPSDATSYPGSLDFGHDSNIGLIEENVGTSTTQRPQRHDGPSTDTDDTKAGATIPNDRFAKVQNCWLGPSNSTGRLINGIWRDVAYGSIENIFAAHPRQSPSSPPVLLQKSRYGLDEDCRRHLHATFGYMRLYSQRNRTSSAPPAYDSALIALAQFPPAEILDMALDLYFRNFHPLVPFIHLPTFSARNTSPSVLYVMCLIGMTFLGTQGTAAFVSKNFTFVLEKLTAELAMCSVGTESSANAMSAFAAAALFLNLAALTGEKGHIEKSQMLYVNLISVAQRHGLFSATEGQLLDKSMFESITDNVLRWKAWSKVESVKRLIIALLVLDAWLSSFLSTSPIIVSDNIQLILPCSEVLFEAKDSTQWVQLIRGGQCMLMPTVLSPSENVEIAPLNSHIDNLGLHAVLSMVQLKLSESYHRLLSNRASYPFAPCHTYAMDGRARCLSTLQIQIASKYGYILGRLDPNASILWHNMCMNLTADIQIFELAAGRAGPGPARKALNDIAAWSQTPAARRACLHAAHVYKVMIHRKASDHITFHSVFSLFTAALVLGLYIYMVPSSTEPQTGGTPIDILDDIDWNSLCGEGFTSFMEPNGAQSCTESDEAAVNFIRNGGTVYFRGVPFQSGYNSARRILLDYASLLKDTGKWSVRKFSHVLYIMSDVLMDMD
ncbi:Zinc finger C2H2 type [Aspergillus parasiticus SU-1]|uniref:C2H2-type domain-containing protein n=2 Tax=Aspergillus parasiticus TaxID=5067 RepID=A0A5N6D8Q1_ASPPA|nr:hypothetical protein BDV34DRAFT_10399 [Aspergillus parasiticus]KJK65283.1 Zinc finger C2H2 type [Aspergillus parasiticus SU-1]